MATAKKVQQKVVSASWPKNVTTLGIDIGGSGVKASVLDKDGQMITERVRQDTPYPCPPKVLLSTIDEVVTKLPKTNRVSVGFPGLVRNGVVIHVPSLSRLEYGGQEDPAMAAAWHGFDLAGELSEMFSLPTKVVNDADMQGCAVAQGTGFEFVMTLGTGVGTAMFNDGKLLDHLELSHGPFKKSTFDLVLGNAGRKSIGKKKWGSWKPSTGSTRCSSSTRSMSAAETPSTWTPRLCPPRLKSYPTPPGSLVVSRVGPRPLIPIADLTAAPVLQSSRSGPRT